MRKCIPLLLILLILVFEIPRLYGQTASTSDHLVAQPIPDRTVPFNVTDPGMSKNVKFGADLAWANEQHFRRAIRFMGLDQVDIVRASFQPTYPLENGDLTQQQIDDLNWRLHLINTWVGPNTDLALNCDHPWVDEWYVGYPERWEQLIAVSTQRYLDAGHNVVAVGAFNEPDYGWGQGTIDDFYNINVLLGNNPLFNNVRLVGGSTLSCDEALSWYNYLLPSGLNEGNTHQLAGSFDSYANFFQAVRANGHQATNDELHNVVEGLVGYEYGMQTGIWWAAAELARGEMVKAFDGQRIGYAEHRPNWTAAAVYRTPEGKIKAFGGTSERQAATTSYNFISKDRVVYFDGHGPQREFVLEMPGGTGYQQGQTNAERVIDITWGDDIQPEINGRYILVNRNSGQVVEVNGTGDGANVFQGSYTGASNQQWDVTPVDSRVGGDFSYYRIKPAFDSNMTMNLIDYSLDNGADINLMTIGGYGGNQQWFLDYAEDGWFYIRSRESSFCLDVDGASGAAGANIQQWEKTSGLNQQWRLLPVGAPIEFVAPSAPGNLVATANAASIRLDWIASPETDVAGYTIFRSESAGGPYNTIARNVKATSFVDNTAILGRQYYYAIKAVDLSLNRSIYSNEVSVAITGENALVAHYQFEGSTQDQSINLNHSASYGDILFGQGKVGSEAIALNGTNAFVQLPADVGSQQEISIAAWVYWNGGSAWQRIFDFGNGQSEYMFLSPASGSGELRFAIKDGGSEQVLSAPALPTASWSHVAVTLGASGARMYVNGQVVAESSAISISPMDFKPVLNYIGRSQYPDPLFNGNIDEFRIYNYALSADEVAQLGGTVTFYQLRNRGTGLYLDGMGRTTNGSNCGQWAGTNSQNSHWELKSVGNGYTQLQNRGTGLYLDGMGRTANGSACGQYANTNHQNSHWAVVQYDGVFYRIQNRGTGLYLDGMGRTTNGQDVGQWANTKHRNAQWELVKVSTSQTLSQTEKGLDDEGLQIFESVSVYPNPVKNVLNIQLKDSEQIARARIFSVSGQLRKSVVLNEQDNKVDVADLPGGMYFLEVTTNAGTIRSRLIKE